MTKKQVVTLVFPPKSVGARSEGGAVYVDNDQIATTEFEDSILRGLARTIKGPFRFQMGYAMPIRPGHWQDTLDEMDDLEIAERRGR